MAKQLKPELSLPAGSTLPKRPMPPVRAGLSLPDSGRLHLVQLATRSLPEYRRALESAGARVLGYLPHQTHLVELDPARRAAIEALDFVERVEPYHPSYRLESTLLSWLESTSPPSRVRVRVVTAERGRAPQKRIADLATSLGARVLTPPSEGLVIDVEVDRAQLRRLVAIDAVQWIDRWTPPGQDLNVLRMDSGADWVERIQGYCGMGVRGEVMDSGVQDDHPDFTSFQQHGLILNLGSHGTSTFGIVFGRGNVDPKGRGLLPCADGIFADYENLDNSDRLTFTSALNVAPYFATFQSNSWGSDEGDKYTSDSVEMDDIVFQLDIPILQSQGNKGGHEGTGSRPQAWAKNVISVGGVFHEDTLDTSDDNWCTFDCQSLLPACNDPRHCKLIDAQCLNKCASIGPAEDGRVKPDVHYWYDKIFAPTVPSTYNVDFGGTSAATPSVAGVVGLIVEMWADNVWGTNPQGQTAFDKRPHASTTKALLINSARQYDFNGPTDDLTRMHQGWGRPSARRAHERAAGSRVVDHDVNLTQGQIQSYDFTVSPGDRDLKVTLVYPDPPALAYASPTLVNNLDLRVLPPGCTTAACTYFGNDGLLTATVSRQGGSPDTINTVENVIIENPVPDENPMPETWRIEVEAVQVNADGVPGTVGIDDATFSLVATTAPPLVPCPQEKNCISAPPGQCSIDRFNCTHQNTGLSECEDANADPFECPPGETIRVGNCPCQAVFPGSVCTTERQWYYCAK